MTEHDDALYGAWLERKREERRAREKYLAHAQSPLYGQRRDDVKYYKREGKPGSYKYYYTKEEYDAAHKNTLKKNVSGGSSGNFDGDAYQRYLNEQKAKRKKEENIRNNEAYAQNAEREKQDKIWAEANIHPYSKILQEFTTDKRTEAQKAQDARNQEIKKGYNSEQKRREDEEIARKLEEERRKNEEAANNSEAERWSRAAEIAEKEKAEREAEAAEEARQAIIKENSDYLRNNIVNTVQDIISIRDALVANPDIVDAAIRNGTFNNIDAAVNDIYKVREINRESEETDPITGLKLKNYELSTEEEMKLINPGYYYSDTEAMLGSTDVITSVEQYNTLYGYTNNCYACTTAMALHKQGYDAYPGRDIDGMTTSNKILGPGRDGKYNTSDDVVDWKNTDYNDMADPDTGVTYESLWSGKFSKTDYIDNTVNSMKKEPAGSYGDFTVTVIMNAGYDGIYGTADDSVCGHSVFYEVNDKGEVEFYDCQNGKKYTESEFKKKYDGSAMKDDKGKNACYTAYKRLDNQTFKGTKAMKNAGKISKSNVTQGIKKGS